MNKLLVCIVCGLVLAVGVLQLRQQNRELAYECGETSQRDQDSAGDTVEPATADCHRNRAQCHR